MIIIPASLKTDMGATVLIVVLAVVAFLYVWNKQKPLRQRDAAARQVPAE